MTTERAVLAGGCFWGMQDLIRRYDGVVSTRVGYTGGEVPNATYRNHGTHAEAIEIIFDPAKLSYRQLLEFSSNSRPEYPQSPGQRYRSELSLRDLLHQR
jgi:peptide-methionine (S)-S-oxide reductase